MSNYKDFTNFMDVSEEVKNAIDSGKAVVALESTIISHGFNYPENLECARECEKRVRESGAIPATIGIIAGRIIVGLTDSQIEHMATDRTIPKASRRDIAALLAKKSDGATTVATTMIFAAMAGIKVFATGGIGGVHRGAQQTFDISADLEELSNTPVAVICAGAKSILDIPLTMEYLETKGVPVLGYNTDDVPGFYTRDSGGSKVDYNFTQISEIANFLKVKEDLKLKGGVLITNPIPAEYEMDSAYILEKIDLAISEANEKGIKGKATTPFLLEKLHNITEGKSVVANKALVFNNCEVAAKIACELENM